MIFVGSFDNFVYCFSRSNGNRNWKRRLDNRITASVIVEGDAILVTPLRGNHVVVLLAADGKIVNSYKLDPEYELVSQPVFGDGILLLPTDKGLVVASSTRATNEPASARHQVSKQRNKPAAVPKPLYYWFMLYQALRRGGSTQGLWGKSIQPEAVSRGVVEN
jgi:hypothetical protein